MNKIKCLDCGHIFDMLKGMVRLSETWFFYCIKCDSINVDYYDSRKEIEKIEKKIVKDMRKACDKRESIILKGGLNGIDR